MIMNKSIRLNKRTLLTFDLPHINLSSNHINLDFTNKLYIQYFNYDIAERNQLKNYFNLDFELYFWGFGISIETIINKKKIDARVDSVKTYFKQLSN